MLEIRMLGQCSVVCDGKPIEAFDASGRLQTFLCYLVLHAGQALPRHHIAFTFWPDSTEKQALTNLRGQLHALRNALPTPDSFLQIGATSLGWDRESPYSLDIDCFVDALTTGRAATPPDRAALERAIDCYRGDLLPGHYDEWLLSERERLRQLHSETLDLMIALLEEEADVPAAIRFAQQVVRLDPLREDAYRKLMTLHLSNGDRVAALRVFHDCASLLERELDVQPDAATQAIYARLLQLDEAGARRDPRQKPRDPRQRRASSAGRRSDANCWPSGDARLAAIAGWRSSPARRAWASRAWRRRSSIGLNTRALTRRKRAVTRPPRTWPMRPWWSGYRARRSRRASRIWSVSGFPRWAVCCRTCWRRIQVCPRPCPSPKAGNAIVSSRRWDASSSPVRNRCCS
ncbi:MAG: hypothetical protein HC802_17195 [Caldilineaceae bacterium]|nr:hypothetical protein [Caldilineaceae bacterium]